MLSLMLMLILTLMLLLVLVDFKINVNISISHDANLGVRSSLFITTTTVQLTGILAFVQAWMFQIRMLYS